MTNDKRAVNVQYTIPRCMVCLHRDEPGSWRAEKRMRQ
jgi:hypothetical protein